MSDYHIPVMLDEVLKLLKIQANHWYVDCNLGGGGHTSAILNLGGNVIGIDLDQDAIAEVAKTHSLEIEQTTNGLTAKSKNLILYQSNFTNIKSAVQFAGQDKVSGVLFDLGVSTYQLETAERGFSFNTDAPLDMRMDKSLSVKASDLVNGLNEGELIELFQKLGEENFAKPIARKIVNSRINTPIQTTNQLAQIILSVRHRRPQDRTHPATRIFQALRIAVNDELNSLKEALPAAFEVLESSGRLAVISFHSLEDRIVKNYFNELVDSGAAKSLTKKPITPTIEEIDTNPRARSGKLRVIEKT